MVHHCSYRSSAFKFLVGVLHRGLQVTLFLERIVVLSLKGGQTVFYSLQLGLLCSQSCHRNFQLFLRQLQGFFLRTHDLIVSCYPGLRKLEMEREAELPPALGIYREMVILPAHSKYSTHAVLLSCDHAKRMLCANPLSKFVIQLKSRGSKKFCRQQGVSHINKCIMLQPGSQEHVGTKSFFESKGGGGVVCLNGKAGSRS